jgi:hypothetical protein
MKNRSKSRTLYVPVTGKKVVPFKKKDQDPKKPKIIGPTVKAPGKGAKGKVGLNIKKKPNEKGLAKQVAAESVSKTLGNVARDSFASTQKQVVFQETKSVSTPTAVHSSFVPVVNGIPFADKKVTVHSSASKQANFSAYASVHSGGPALVGQQGAAKGRSTSAPSTGTQEGGQQVTPDSGRGAEGGGEIPSEVPIDEAQKQRLVDLALRDLTRSHPDAQLVDAEIKYYQGNRNIPVLIVSIDLDTSAGSFTYLGSLDGSLIIGQPNVTQFPGNGTLTAVIRPSRIPAAAIPSSIDLSQVATSIMDEIVKQVPFATFPENLHISTSRELTFQSGYDHRMKRILISSDCVGEDGVVSSTQRCLRSVKRLLLMPVLASGIDQVGAPLNKAQMQVVLAMSQVMLDGQEQAADNALGRKISAFIDKRRANKQSVLAGLWELALFLSGTPATQQTDAAILAIEKASGSRK